MKRCNGATLLTLLTLVTLLTPQCAPAQVTSFTYALYNADGTPATNPITMFPVQVGGVNTVTLVGTNAIFPVPVVMNPGGNNTGTNVVEPGSYKCSMLTSFGSTIYFYLNIPPTAAVLPFTAYVSGAPALYTPSSLFGFITNALGGPAGLIQALQFQPMTNTPAGVTNVLTLNTLTNLLGLNGLTNLLGLNGETNLLGLNGQTNLLGISGATNLLGLNGVTNLLGFGGLTNLLGGTPVLTNNPTFLLTLTNASAFYATNIPLLRGFSEAAGSGLTNAFVTNADGSFTPVLGWTNPTAPLFTGTISNAADGVIYRVNITNGLIINTNTP